MPRAKIEEETIQGVPGVRYWTEAMAETSGETRLQEIQYALSDGNTDPEVTDPHLEGYIADTIWPDGGHGPSVRFVSLWVPVELRGEAERLLVDAEFELT